MLTLTDGSAYGLGALSDYTTPWSTTNPTGYYNPATGGPGAAPAPAPSAGSPGSIQSTPAVAKLQVALVALAQVAGKPIINPGSPTGYVGQSTVNAVVASMSLLTKHLGSIGGLLSAGLAIYSIADQARAAALITQYASQLEQAARGAAIAIAQGQQSPALPGTVGPGVIALTTPWYKTWWGMGALAVGGVGLLAVLLAPRRAEAKAA